MELDLQSKETGQAVLYDRYGPIIYRYLRAHAPSLEDAEDLLLEVFLAALEQDRLLHYPPERQLAWLRTVARNKLYSFYRRTQRHPQIPLDSQADYLFANEEPEHLALQQEEQGHLYRCIQTLPKPQQHLLQLRYGYHLRFAEIAQLLEKSEGTVRKMLSRSLAILRKTYQKEGDLPC